MNGTRRERIQCTQAHERKSFFHKNVENEQGDETEVIAMFLEVFLINTKVNFKLLFSRDMQKMEATDELRCCSVYLTHLARTGV